MRRYLIWAAVVYLLLLLFPCRFWENRAKNTKAAKEFSALPGADKDGDSKGYSASKAQTPGGVRVPELDL